MIPVSVKSAPVTICDSPGRPPEAAAPALTSSLAEIGRFQAASDQAQAASAAPPPRVPPPPPGRY